MTVVGDWRVHLVPSQAMLVAGLLLAWHATALAAEGSACWTPKQLGAREGDAAIRKDVADAYRPLPTEPAHAASSPYPEHAGKVLRRVDLPPGKKLVAFTFDLCEQPFEISGYQGDIVDFLRDNNVKATFFAGGKWLVTHPERAEQLLADPLFEVENHAWEHRNFRVVTKPVRLSEIDGALGAYAEVKQRLAQRMCLARDGKPVNQSAAPRQTLFRFPFGACTPEAIAEVTSRGLLPVQWDISSSDPWAGQTVDQLIDTVMKQIRPGSIVLFHANGRGFKTGPALPQLIRRLRAQGFEFATVTELLAVPGAKPVTSTDCYDFKPHDVERYDKLARRIEETSEQFYKRFAPQRAARSAPAAEPAPIVNTQEAGPTPSGNAKSKVKAERKAPQGRGAKEEVSPKSEGVGKSQAQSDPAAVPSPREQKAEPKPAEQGEAKAKADAVEPDGNGKSAVRKRTGETVPGTANAPPPAAGDDVPVLGRAPVPAVSASEVQRADDPAAAGPELKGSLEPAALPGGPSLQPPVDQPAAQPEPKVDSPAPSDAPAGVLPPKTSNPSTAEAPSQPDAQAPSQAQTPAPVQPREPAAATTGSPEAPYSPYLDMGKNLRRAQEPPAPAP